MSARGILGLAFLAAAAAGGCSTGPRSVGVRLAGPTAVVRYAGVTSKGPGLREYLAVTASRGDELRIVDPSDEQPVLGPGLVFPLSVPTAPRPLQLASATLDDGGADVLVVVSAGARGAFLGGPVLQVVNTWTPYTTIAFEVPLDRVASAAGEADVLSLLGLTLPGGAGARVLVGLAGGRLAAVDFTRDPATGGVVASPAVAVQTLGFDPVDLALDPGGTRVYAATPDPIPVPGGKTVLGVATIDPTGAPPWPVGALDALAPTVSVAVDRVRERILGASDDLGNTDQTAPDRFQGGPDSIQPVQVYAALDNRACGPTFAINCGVVTLLPSTGGLAPDPVNELPYRAPMQLAGVPGPMTILRPPASGTSRILNDTYNPNIPLMLTAPGSGQRNTSRVGVAASSDGRVYLLDLGRWGPMNDISLMRSSTRVSVPRASSVQPTTVLDPASSEYGKTVGLALWNDFPQNAAAAGTVTGVLLDPTLLPAFFQVTPGYTEADEWRITWQGSLPQLGGRDGIALRTGAGDVVVAMQAATGNAGAAAWLVGAQVGNPELGAHPGDLVHLDCTDAAGNAASDEAPLTAILQVPASGATLAVDSVPLPGGALRIPAGSGPCLSQLPAPSCSGASCVAVPVTTLVTVRASGLLLTSQGLGYAGRPTFDAPYALQWAPETNLAGEALSLVRKARRRFYPTDPPCPSVGQLGCYAGYPWLADPLAPGPLVAFKVGLVAQGAPDIPLDSTDPAVLAGIPREAAIPFSTQSGVNPTFRRPGSGGAGPGRMLGYDRSGFAGHENDPIRAFVPFLDDQLISFSPSESLGDVTSLR